MPESIEELPRTADPAANLFGYLKDRTRIGLGFEETYRDNLLARDNNKQEEFISTLEAEVFFSDPRGALLYGIDFEVNARHYHNQRVDAVDRDGHIFVDIDPGGRYKFGAHYDYALNNAFTFGTRTTEIDVVERFNSLRQDSTHVLGAGYTYALNDTNALINSVSFTKNRVVRPAGANQADRDTISASLRLDHDLRPGWVIYGGYGFQDVKLPADSQKNSQAHGIHAGLRYELSELTKLEARVEGIRREFKVGKISTQPQFSLEWNYLVSPRTSLNLKYSRSSIPSFTPARLEFQSSTITGEAAYQLTPLMKTTFGGSYGRSKSGGESLLPGATVTSLKPSVLYSVNSSLEWELREKWHLSLYYKYIRARTSDYTENSVTLQIEKEY